MAEKATFHSSYQYSDGDIVLGCSDNVHFRVHSLILKLASGFFREMLEIPRSASESPDDAIPLAENSSVISGLLDLIYPTASEGLDDGAHLPRITSLSSAWAITAAADKYDMPRALAAVRAIIMTPGSMYRQTLDIYAFASRWNWVEEARLASAGTLATPLLQSRNLPTLRSMDAESLCKLFELHTARKEAILKFFDLNDRNFIVNQWECGCPTEDGETKTETFMRMWDSMRCHVIASLEASPLGRELQESTFWSNQDSKLWNLPCRRCGGSMLNKQCFIGRVREVFQRASLPSFV